MKGIRIRTEQQGTRATLFDLEADVMEVVWEQGWPWFAVSKVLAVLQQSRSIAYTTVMTTVSRLHDKGLLERKRDGRRYLYQTRYSQEELAQAMASEVLDCLGPGSQQAAMALLVDRVSRADVAELERLEQMIRERREELKRG